mgnify:CR=1 FL=1
MKSGPVRAAALATLALVLVACGRPTDPPAPPPEAGAAGESTAPEAEAPAPDGLTPAAADTFRRLQAAAESRDTAALIAIAAESPGFAYTFGDEADFAEYVAGAQMRGRDPVGDLAQILAMPPGETTLDGVRVFHWPYFYDWEASRYTAETRADAARIVGEAAAAQINDDLAYLGPRAAIDENGQWIFYLTGD